MLCVRRERYFLVGLKLGLCFGANLWGRENIVVERRMPLGFERCHRRPLVMVCLLMLFDVLVSILYFSLALSMGIGLNVFASNALL